VFEAMASVSTHDEVVPAEWMKKGPAASIVAPKGHSNRSGLTEPSTSPRRGCAEWRRTNSTYPSRLGAGMLCPLSGRRPSYPHGRIGRNPAGEAASRTSAFGNGSEAANDRLGSEAGATALTGENLTIDFYANVSPWDG
jgi:hypothetical protein